jgi:hypothetical protein
MFEFEFKTKACFQKEQKKERKREINKRKTPSAPPLSRRPDSLVPAVPCAPSFSPWPSSAFPLAGPRRERPNQPFPRPRRSKSRAAHPTAPTPPPCPLPRARRVASARPGGLQRGALPARGPTCSRMARPAPPPPVRARAPRLGRPWRGQAWWPGAALWPSSATAPPLSSPGRGFLAPACTHGGSPGAAARPTRSPAPAQEA